MMGVGIYIYKVRKKWIRGKNCEVKSIQRDRVFRRLFKDYSFKKKVHRMINPKEPFKKRGLKEKDWGYLHSDGGFDYFIHNKREERIRIPTKEFIIKKVPRVHIKIQKIGYFSGSGKLRSAWFGLDDISPRRINIRLHHILTKDISIFIEWFVSPRYRELFKEKLSIMKENCFMSVCW